MRNHVHNFAMSLVFIGGVMLLLLAYYWYSINNLLMASGMLIMGVVALSNLYLHATAMRKK